MTFTRIIAAIAALWAAASVMAADSSDSVSAAESSCASLGPARALERDDLEAWLDGVIPFALQQGDMAGAVVLVIKDGRVLLQKGYGYADLVTRTPMDPSQSILGVGSVSKTFTWTAVMQLVEQGKLDLDRDVNEYLDFKIPEAFGAPITVRHLMTHTAGFEERLKQYITAGMPGRTLAEHLKTTPAPTRIYAPGTVQAYSNYGTDLAGYIVERVSGEPFAAYVQRHILEPLGMRHSTFQRPVPDSLQANLAKYYHVASEPTPFAPHDNIDEVAGSPSGDLISSAEDMSKFMLAHLQGGQLGGYTLLEPATVNLMHAAAHTAVPGAPGTALGFFRGDYNGRLAISHSGDLSGFHTDMQLLPEEGVGLFFSVNSDGGGGLVGAAYQLRALLFQQFMDRYFPAATHATEPTTTTALEHARIVAGEYEMSRRPSGDFPDALFLSARLQLTAHEDGTLETPGLLSFDTGRPRRWREVAPFVWREVGGCARLLMNVNNDRVIAWQPSNVASFEALPVPYWRSAALNVPLLICAVLVLCSAAVAWPVAAVVRRRFASRLMIEPREALARRWAQVAVAIALLFLLAYLFLIAVIAGNPSLMDIGLDPWIRAVQCVGLLSVITAPGALWHAWSACRGSRGWWAKASSILVALAILGIVWFSLAFHLLSASLNY
jgi:CubicO group peptidase (beta-lactamase class C family)